MKNNMKRRRQAVKREFKSGDGLTGEEKDEGVSKKTMEFDDGVSKKTTEILEGVAKKTTRLEAIQRLNRLGKGGKNK